MRSCDVPSLYRDFGIVIVNAIDTQVMPVFWSVGLSQDKKIVCRTKSVVAFTFLGRSVQKPASALVVVSTS